MGRIDLTEEFFEDEVREGFYIPACIKQAWGAQIRVLNEVDRVCSELGIRYFADWGTFLGAVRHGGFVPWDDDFDICMLRDDYNRFLEEGVKLLPEGFMVYNFENKKDHEQFVAGIVAKNRICFEDEHLDKFHGFPYIAAIDVFLIDYVSPDGEEQDAMRKRAQRILAVSDGIRFGRLKGELLKEKLSELEAGLGLRLPAGITDQETRRLLDMAAEKEFAAFLDKKEDAKEVVQMMPWGLNETKRMPKEYYSKTIDIPFETGTIPVPLYYDDALRRKYGDYMFMHKNAGGHDYPFFAKSRAGLQEVLDFDLPEFKVDEVTVLKKAADRKEQVKEADTEGKTYRAVVKECVAEMIRLGEMLASPVDKAQICTDIQQLAIDLGTYMEAIKGEGYDLVGLLESLCESLYEHSVSEGDGDPSGVLDLLYGLREKTDRRREVLLLPFKDIYWNTMDGLYRAMLDDQDTDVYVVPIPYYYKDYKHRLKNMQYRTECYPSDIKIVHYDEYDYVLRHPDIIITQNPYDDINEESSLPPFFFSDKLLDLTDKLVYVPWFETYDFTEENEREYINMKHYCTVPGLINADLILLGSDVLKQTYIKKLTEFAGSGTENIWKEKIVVRGSEDELAALGIREDEKVSAASENEGENDKGTIRKTMVYYPDFSDIMYFGDRALSKVRESVRTFEENGSELDFVIIKGRHIEDRLKELKPDLYADYIRILNDAAENDHIRLIDETAADLDKLVKECTAYYGDGGRLAHMFRNAGKPVMIQNYEIQSNNEE